MLKSYHEVNTMKDFFEEENLGYPANEHEEINNEHIENVEIISNLLKELLTQLSNRDITNLSKELYDWSVESNSLDNNSSKNQYAKENTSDIGSILREITIKNIEKELRIIEESCQKINNLKIINLNQVQKRIQNANIILQNVGNHSEDNQKNNAFNANKNNENIKTMSTEDLQKRYSELLSILETYKNEKEQNLPDDFYEAANEIEQIANLLVSRGEPIILSDGKEKNNNLEQKIEMNQEEDMLTKPVFSFNQELNNALNKAITNINLSSRKLDDNPILNDDENMVNEFKKIFQKNLENAANVQEETNKVHKKNIKTILQTSSQNQFDQKEVKIQTQKTHEEKLKEILNPTSSKEFDFKVEKEEAKSEMENLNEDSEISFDLNELNLTEEDKDEEKSEKKQEVKSVRKPKKNILKKLITQISTVAVTLVLICAESPSIIKKITNTKDVQALENNVNNLDDADIQMIHSNNNTIYYPESKSNEEVQFQNNNESKDNNTTENTFSNLIYLDDVIAPYTQYKEDKFDIFDENSIQIGSEVVVNGDAHSNVFDAYFQENSHVPTVDNDTKRIVLGVGINDGQEIVRKYIYNENPNKDIQQMINNGGEIVTVLTANKDKYFSNYGNTEKITKEQLENIAEGWYNINNVNLEKTKGLSR